jgi:predicted transcriptional regulator
MNWLNILEKLELAKEFLTEEVPIGLERAAEITDMVSEALRDAAAFLKDRKVVSAADAKQGKDVQKRLQAIVSECHTFNTKVTKVKEGATPVGAVWEDVLAQLLSKAAEELLEWWKNRNRK